MLATQRKYETSVTNLSSPIYGYKHMVIERFWDHFYKNETLFTQKTLNVITRSYVFWGKGSYGRTRIGTDMFYGSIY